MDFGMVDRISAPRRESLRRAFSAVVDRDALGLVRSLVDMGFIPLTRDIQPLVQFVDRILHKYRDISPSEFKAMDIEEIGNDIMEGLQLNPSIQIPNDFILFGRVIGMLNGLGSRLDPDTNIIEIAAPYARRFIRAEEFSACGLLQQAGFRARAALRLPQLLSEFLVTTSRGETRVEITSQQVVDELKNIARIGKGFIFAILTGGARTGLGLPAYQSFRDGKLLDRGRRYPAVPLGPAHCEKNARKPVVTRCNFHIGFCTINRFCLPLTLPAFLIDLIKITHTRHAVRQCALKFQAGLKCPCPRISTRCPNDDGSLPNDNNLA